MVLALRCPCSGGSNVSPQQHILYLWFLGMLYPALQRFYSEVLFTACTLLWGQTFSFWYKSSHIPLSEKQMVSKKKLEFNPPSASLTVVIPGLPSQCLQVNNHPNVCSLSPLKPLESICSFLPLF